MLGQVAKGFPDSVKTCLKHEARANFRHLAEKGMRAPTRKSFNKVFLEKHISDLSCLLCGEKIRLLLSTIAI